MRKRCVFIWVRLLCLLTRDLCRLLVQTTQHLNLLMLPMVLTLPAVLLRTCSCCELVCLDVCYSVALFGTGVKLGAGLKMVVRVVVGSANTQRVQTAPIRTAR